MLPKMLAESGGGMRSAARICAVLLWVVAGWAGCYAGDNMQSRPIGEKCSDNGMCGTRPYSCLTSYPNGYCQKDCATDGDCPSDAVCVSRECRRKCHSDSECRAPEGYACIMAGPNPYCDLPSQPDGGS